MRDIRTQAATTQDAPVNNTGGDCRGDTSCNNIAAAS
jgi:hypothetical protein